MQDRNIVRTKFTIRKRWSQNVGAKCLHLNMLTIILTVMSLNGSHWTVHSSDAKTDLHEHTECSSLTENSECIF